MLKAFVEGLRGARHIEALALIVLIALIGLAMIGSANRTPADGTDMEKRLERLLEGIDGVEDVRVMIAVDEFDKPVGAAVVSHAPLQVRTALEIESALQVLLDIDAQHIRVIGGGGWKGE